MSPVLLQAIVPLGYIYSPPQLDAESWAPESAGAPLAASPGLPGQRRWAAAPGAARTKCGGRFPAAAGSDCHDNQQADYSITAFLWKSDRKPRDDTSEASCGAWFSKRQAMFNFLIHLVIMFANLILNLFLLLSLSLLLFYHRCLGNARKVKRKKEKKTYWFSFLQENLQMHSAPRVKALPAWRECDTFGRVLEPWPICKTCPKTCQTCPKNPQWNCLCCSLWNRAVSLCCASFSQLTCSCSTTMLLSASMCFSSFVWV